MVALGVKGSAPIRKQGHGREDAALGCASGARIVVIGPSVKMGGIERAGATLASEFAGAGHLVAFIALFQQERFFELHPAVRFVEPTGISNPNRLSLGTTLRYLRREVTALRPDAVLVLGKFYGALSVMALAGTRLPVYVSDRASPLFRWRRHVAAFNRIAFGAAPPAGVIAQTSTAAEAQRRYFGKSIPIQVIPNPVREVQRFAAERKRQVLGVGRINDALKGFDRLLEAFSRVDAPDWELVIAGGGDDGGALLRLAENLGIEDRLRLLGNVRDIDRVYAEASIFVIPSRSEGFPNALCEAMAAGLPCISFDFTAGPRDIISPGETGVLVPEGDIDALGREIERLTRDVDERERLGRNALSIRERLRSSRVADQYLAFILAQTYP